MEALQNFDVIIIGGSNAGLSAAMALGRALKQVLVVDSGLPCNRQTPHSHNFITHDGWKPAEIIEAARRELLNYHTVQLLNGLVADVTGSDGSFEVTLADHGFKYKAKKLLFTTGIKDIMPELKGFAECWGISVIHCPFCHGYEYREKSTGLLMNNELTADFAKLINNWTNDLTVFTNGKSLLTPEQQQATLTKGIRIVETTIESLEHVNGYLKQIRFEDGSFQPLDALYARPRFKQHCHIPQKLGCQITEQGYIQINEQKKTSIAGIYAAGDNTSPMRSVAAAVGAGNFAGAMLVHELIHEH